MPAEILDGKAVAETVKQEVAVGVVALGDASGVVPGLATVLVGDDPASHVYVRNKRRTAERLGITSFHHELPATAFLHACKKKTIKNKNICLCQMRGAGEVR